MESFKKRQKEMRRLAAGITTESGPDTEAIENAEALDPADLTIMD